MKNVDKFSESIRCRLNDAQLEVRNGFWEDLQTNIPVANNKQRLAWWWVAATILLVLGWRTFSWMNSHEEVHKAINEPIAYAPKATQNKEVTQTDWKEQHTQVVNRQQTKMASSTPQAPYYHQASYSDEQANNNPYNNKYEYAEVHVRVTISQSKTTKQETTQAHANNYAQGMGSDVQSTTSEVATSHPTPWAMKAFVGCAMPSNEYAMPLSAGVTFERSISKRLSLETGLIYNQIEALNDANSKEKLHTLEVPIKMNATLAESKRAHLYASVGASIEKCIAGASDNSFDAEPLQASLNAGLGVGYKLNDSLQLFAETTLSHHFDNSSHSRTLYNERATNLNLACGVRMKL